MVMLKKSSDVEIERLLDLYPASALKSFWTNHKKASKRELCSAIASERDIDGIADFLATYFSCCKQHVYVSSHDAALKSAPEIRFSGGGRVWELDEKGQKESLHIVKVVYDIVLNNPLEETTLEFLWPVWLSWTSKHLIIRFITMEKNAESYFAGRAPMRRGRSIDEESLIKHVANEFEHTLQVTDLHKGLKRVWADDFMDARRVQFRKAHSTASEMMDEEKGIKQSDPELYALLQTAHINSALFSVLGVKEKFSVSALSIHPSEGYVAFPRFSEQPGDTDYVVREILRHN